MGISSTLAARETIENGAAARVHYVVRTSDRVLKLAISAIPEEPGFARVQGYVVVNTAATPTAEIDAAVSRELAAMSETWAKDQLMFISYRSPVPADHSDAA